MYDAVLIVSFGGPEGPDDVMPFLENVLRGRNVPRERLLEVAEHYQQFGGVSPINAQNRALIAALQHELDEYGPHLPIYWGNRNWRPLLTDTLRQMAQDGVHHALAFFTSAFSSYSGCRQYRENVTEAQAAVGPSAPQVDKLRVFFNHPGYIETMVDRAAAALAQVPRERLGRTRVLYTAHSIPLAMAENCRYVEQLTECARLISERLDWADGQLVYQSRSGPPQQPWLEPDVCDALTQLRETSDTSDVVLVPIGFISDHMEVVFDLDTQAKQHGADLGMNVVRAGTAGTHPRFIRMIRELIEERMSQDPDRERPTLGCLGPSHDVCPVDCCLPRRPSSV
jgi:protoporphyrin/coproporphyrin ferrochelatase